MKLKKSTILYFLMGLSIVSACKKIDYPSRDISSLKPDPIVVVPPDPGISYIIFDNCDSKDGWNIAGPSSVATDGKKEGTGYLSSKIASGEDFMQFERKLTAPLDTKLTLTTGQFIFWLYISDVSALKLDGQIQISSALDPDKNRVGWGLAEIIPTLKNGWNQLKLDLSKGGVTGDGGPNLGAMNYFRIFFWTEGKASADVNVGLDDLKFLQIPEAPKSFALLDGCDKLDGWDLPGDMAATIETAGKKEGTGYIKGKVPSGGDFMRFAKIFDTKFDTKVTKDNGQLTFWFYVERVEEFGEIQVQISSTDNIDATRYGWSLLESDNLGIPALKEGWNEVKLDISKVSYDADGGADLTGIKYFRIFGITKAKVTSDLTVGLDGVKFIMK